MADPTPVIGMPEAEYIEIYNRSPKEIHLKGWQLVTGNRSVELPDSTILPGLYMVICHKNNSGLLTGYGKTIGLNSFSLTNEGMMLALYNRQNQLVYSISYLNKWWASEKQDGGYSLEMIDTDNPCGEISNWSASVAVRGGTPAGLNSVKATLADVEPPFVERVDIEQNGELTIIFNERMDSLNAVSGAEITLSGRNIIKRQLETPSFRRLKLIPDNPLLSQQEYRLNVRNISDCSGNLLRESEHTLAMPMQADSGDVVINEILFNPGEHGVDFVELYNRSKKYINISNWTLGNTKNEELNISRVITSDAVIMAPNSYLAITADPFAVKEQYPVNRSGSFLEMISFPAYSNADGGVILMDNRSHVLDKFIYSEKMHHVLIGNVKGVSLEKIDAGKPSWEVLNWHSAAATVGYATPGYANSQKWQEEPDDAFVVEPEAFTPNDDGLDDYTAIRYKQSVTGRVASLRIYNINGSLVRNLLDNQLTGTSGEIRWDGTDNHGKLVPTGYYLLLIDTFDITGVAQQYKKRVIVARRDQ